MADMKSSEQCVTSIDIMKTEHSRDISEQT